MSQPTAARPRLSESAHWYNRDGTPLYEVPYADPKKGMRKATLADARKVAAIPSVTNYLNILDKPALTNWIIEQAIHAVLTTPKLPGEALDAYVHRVIQVEKVQEEEASIARDKGTAIHAAMEALFDNRPPSEWTGWVHPAYVHVQTLIAPGKMIHLEQILFSERHAGKADLIVDDGERDLIVDWKSTGKLPKDGSWPEHRLQLAAYAKSWSEVNFRPIRTANCYISTAEQGKFAYFENPPWELDWPVFESVMKVWWWLKGYDPIEANKQWEKEHD